MLKKIDSFGKNIILVFVGSSILNCLNFLYQLLIAHKLSAVDFAAFNSLLAVVTVISTPLSAFQASVTKYISEFYAKNQLGKIKALLVNLLKITLILAAISFITFYFISASTLNNLKIYSPASRYILTILVTLSWLGPVLSGYAQGLEFFKLLMVVSIVGGILKLALGWVLIILGFKISGALAALLASSLVSLIILFLPLKKYFDFNVKKEGVNLKEVFIYQTPVALSLFCFTSLVNFDMVLVKYYFSPQNAGLYALGQMVGKIFLFLPVAISFVMFPRVSGLKAKNIETLSILKRSIYYTLILCALGAAFYNIFPLFVLKVITGKTTLDSVVLGRFFSFSMICFTLSFLFINYFLSIQDLRFIKYLIISTLLQFLFIFLLHGSLIQVQLILCVNSLLLLLVNGALAFLKPRESK